MSEGNFLEFADWFWKRTKAAHPRMREPVAAQWGKWLAASEKLFEEYPAEAVYAAAIWLFETDGDAAWWRSTVLTLPQFRLKIDMIEAKRSYEEDAPRRSAARPTTGPVLGAAERILARYQSTH